ncbi:MAG: two-component regulator propeller domain-containing protein, partial [Bacteroidaceae bacterium]
MKTHRLILSLLLLICVSLSSAFAGKYYSFKHLSTIDGLSHNQINNIFKDSDGFLWFSTSGGLNRFDGYQFKIFRHDDNDKYSITDNFTDNIQEDAQGNLWIHTSSSYILFDRDKEKFYSDMLSYLHIPEGKLPSCPSVVYIDKKKNILLVQDTKVFLYKPETGKIVVFY